VKRRSLPALTGVLTLATLAALLSARPADAYVRYTSNAGKTFMWPQSCVMIVAYPNDLLGMMTRDEILGAVDAAASAWSKSSDACTYLDLMISSSSDATPRAINDGRNNVIFRTSTWCKLTDKGVCDTAMLYDPAALALTSVSASTSSGVIRDADVEVNASNFNWADLVTHPNLRDGQSFHDLQNALTHEMGHLIGLDHTCYLQGPAPLDNNGQPIPDCADAPPDVLATTMFPSANPGDIDKRDLAPDDQQAVCDIYPASHDPMTCAPSQTDPGGCGCSAAGAPGPALAALVVLLAALLATRARRRRG
jgi:MYXO-CTERM domain-containing protein